MALSDLRYSLSSSRGRSAIAAAAVAVALLAWVGVRFLSSVDPAPDPPAPAPQQVAAPELPAASPSLPQTAPEPVHYPEVLVATGNLGVGVMLVSERVAWQEWREAVDPENILVKDIVPLEAVLGSVTRRALPRGAPVAWDDIILPGGAGFIAAVLQPGMRAVTINVSHATTTANVIYPGDRVDVVLVAAAGGDEIAAQSIVEDVRVLAVGSTPLSADRFRPRSGLAEELTELSDIGMPILPPSDNYTLEVGPRDANRLALAATSGSIVLATRGLVSQSLPDYGGSGLGFPVHWREFMVEPEQLEVDVTVPSVRVIRVRKSGIEKQTVVLGAPDASDGLAPDGPEEPTAGLGAET